MNAKKMIAAIAVLTATGSAYAQQTYPYVQFSGFQSTETRAGVMAELKTGRASENYIVGGNEYVAPAAHFVSTNTRAQVIAELERSKADGSYALAHQEYEGQFPGLNYSGKAGIRLVGNGTAPSIN